MKSNTRISIFGISVQWVLITFRYICYVCPPLMVSQWCTMAWSHNVAYQQGQNNGQSASWITDRFTGPWSGCKRGRRDIVVVFLWDFVTRHNLLEASRMGSTLMVRSIASVNGIALLCQANQANIMPLIWLCNGLFNCLKGYRHIIIFKIGQKAARWSKLGFEIFRVAYN